MFDVALQLGRPCGRFYSVCRNRTIVARLVARLGELHREGCWIGPGQSLDWTSGPNARYPKRGGLVNDFGAECRNSKEVMQVQSDKGLVESDRAAASCNGSAPAGGSANGSDRLGDTVVEVALAALYRRIDGRVELLVARRPDHAVRGGLWEFPGGKLESGEAPRCAAVRELAEEVGITADAFIEEPSVLAVVEHSDPELTRERSIRLHAFMVEVKPEAVACSTSGGELRWIEVAQLAQLEWPKANAGINARLCELLA